MTADIKTIFANRNELIPRSIQAGTRGSQKLVKLRFEFSDEWDGSEKRVVFYPRRSKPIQVPYLSGEIDIPPEVMQYEGETPYVVSGTLVSNGELEAKRVSLPGYVEVEYTLDDKGGNSRKVTPDTYDIFLTEAEQYMENVLREAKESGEFDGVSVTHRWNGTVLEVTSASGTTSADLKGETGNGILRIEFADSNGDYDTYSIVFTNGAVYQYVIKNGSSPVIGDNGNWWVDGVDTGVPLDAGAGEYARQAAESASSASASASSAAESETNAANSAVAASESEEAAAKSEKNAELYKTAALNYMSTTSQYKADASESAQNAADSASAAQTSAESALSHKNSASTSAKDALKYYNSAKYMRDYAEDARDEAETFASAAAASAAEAAESADRAEEAAASSVKSVNGVTPDANGNVEIESGGTVEVDATLTKAGMAADAAAVGEAIGKLSAGITIEDDGEGNVTIKSAATGGDIAITDDGEGNLTIGGAA